MTTAEHRERRDDTPVDPLAAWLDARAAGFAADRAAAAARARARAAHLAGTQLHRAALVTAA
jgi:hypothetical protein